MTKLNTDTKEKIAKKLCDYYITRLHINNDIAELFFSINGDNVFTKLLNNDNQNFFKKKLDGYLKRNISLYDVSNIETKIISNFKIFFGDDLNFCLLFNKIDSAGNSETYELLASTLSVSYNANDELFDDLKNIYNASERKMNIVFDGNRQTLSIQNYPLQKLSLFIPSVMSEKKNRKRTVKDYRFTFFSIALINNSRNILLLGFKKLNNKTSIKLQKEEIELIKNVDYFQLKLDNYLRVFEEKIDEIKRISAYLESRSKTRKEDIYKTYAKIITVYKNVMDDENIDSVHFFKFNVFDRRLYYTFVETMTINAQTFNNYRSSVHNLLKLGMDLKLTDNQIAFVKSNIEKLYENLDPNDISLDLLNKIVEIFHKPDEIAKKLFPQGQDSVPDEKMVWHILLVLSCIPQEPWTGVAGFSANSRVFDISSSGEDRDFGEKLTERRWEPKDLDRAHFYSKLMIFERIAGVGGQGSMAAFPILDSGQIAGIIFITKSLPNDEVYSKPKRKNPLLFSSTTLHELLALSSLLKSFIWMKRNNDFADAVIKELLSDPKEIMNPFKVIGENLPILFNPLLVVLWEYDPTKGMPKKPKYIWGYKKRNYATEPPEIELIPLEYQFFKIDDNIYNSFEEKFFTSIQKAKSINDKELETNSKFQLKWINNSEIEESLPKIFLKKYETLTQEGSFQERMNQNYSPGTKLRYSTGLAFCVSHLGKEYILESFFEESEDVLKENYQYLLQKFDKMYSVIFSNDHLIKIATFKLASSHDLQTAHTTPLREKLEYVESILDSIEDAGQLKPKLDEGKRILKYCNNFLMKNLVNAIARIDYRTVKSNYKPERINLVETIRNIWIDFRLNRARERGSYNEFIVENANLFYTLEDNLGSTINILTERESQIYEETIFINFKPDEFYAIISNLLNNTFKPTVLPLEGFLDIAPSKANIYIGIKEFEDCYKLSYKNQGKQLNTDQLEWINDIIKEVELSEVGKEYLSPNIMDKYYTTFTDISHIENKMSIQKHGYGIFNILKYLRENGINIKDHQNYFNVESRADSTTFNLIFPKSIRTI